MYAQLCKRLSEEAPNFDPPNRPCIFNRLLLNKCQDEFESRRKAFEVWDESDGRVLPPEEEEQRQNARRKMVGNLRFIGELGKLEIVQESILHCCIQQLLEKRKRRSVADLAEDLECLCQIMKTCGKVLDKPEAKNWMDQYFKRMKSLQSNAELPSRIRFMLQDVVELRAADWVPRKVGQLEGPRTIQEVREEAARDLGVYIPPPSSQGPPRSSGPLSPISGLTPFFSSTSGTRTGMEDVFGPMVTGMLGTGPGVISSQPDKFSYDANSLSNGAGGREGGFRPRQQQGVFSQNSFYQNKHFSNQSFNKQQQSSQFSPQQNFSSSSAKDLPPRFKKMFIGGNSAGNEVSLRPAASSVTLKPKTPANLPQSALGSASMLTTGVDQHTGLPLAPQPQPPNQKPTPPLMHKEPPILIKAASSDKPRSSKKEKGPTKEEWLKKVHEIVEELLKDANPEDAAESYRNVRLPDRLAADATSTILIFLLHQDESGREAGCQLMKHLKADNLITSDRFMEGIRQVLNQLDELVVDVPRVKSHLSGILGHLVASEALALTDISEPLEGGCHFPLFLLVLQTLHKLEGKTQLMTTFSESKINILNMLPESDRTKEKLADLLEDRDLSFLVPLLRIQADLWQTLVNDPSPLAFYKYIKDTLSAEHHGAHEFINALVTVLVKYIVQETTLASGIDPSTVPEKGVTEQERELLSRFKQVLQAFLHDQIKLQVTAIYALQVFTYTQGFPKGMLLRWFINLYDLEIIEEEAFLSWKEDLSQDNPGKGKALFQVNQWLTWLQEAEEDEDEEEIDA